MENFKVEFNRMIDTEIDRRMFGVRDTVRAEVIAEMIESQDSAVYEKSKQVNRVLVKSNYNKHDMLKFNGVSMTIEEWAEYKDMKEATLLNRLNRQGWSIKKSLSEPINIIQSYRGSAAKANRSGYGFRGELPCAVSKMAKTAGVTPTTIINRLRDPTWSIKEIMSTPANGRKRNRRRSSVNINIHQ